MDDKRVKAGPPLGGKNTGHSAIVTGIGAQAVDGFGWEGDQPPFGQDRGCGSQSLRGGGQSCRLHNVSPMTQRYL